MRYYRRPRYGVRFGIDSYYSFITQNRETNQKREKCQEAVTRCKQGLSDAYFGLEDLAKYAYDILSQLKYEVREGLVEKPVLQAKERQIMGLVDYCQKSMRVINDFERKIQTLVKVVKE